jgi:hypothetical protein
MQTVKCYFSGKLALLKNCVPVIEQDGEIVYVYKWPRGCHSFIYGGKHYLNDYYQSNGFVIDYFGNYEKLADCELINGNYHSRANLYYYNNQWNLNAKGRVNSLYPYNGSVKEKNYLTDAAPGFPVCGFGIEIEKSEMPAFDFYKEEVYYQSGAVIEQDSSVSNGFELKTPVYNLFSSVTYERLEKLKEFANVRGTDNAGGHVGISVEGLTDSELLDKLRGALPIIYSMYHNRLHNYYCKAKKIGQLKKDREKMQAINLRGDYLEFRICSAVKKYETVLFRLEFFKFLCSNLGASFGKLLTQIITPGTVANNLFLSVYQPKKLFLILSRAVTLNQEFGRKLPEASIKKITELLNRFNQSINESI